MNRETLFPKIRKDFLTNINGYLKHEKLDDIDNFIVRSKFKDELGLISSAAVGATGDIWKSN